MKRLFAVILVCLLCATAAYAAEWGEGLGPEHPMPGVPAIELDKEMGYSYYIPSEKLGIDYFCDVLEIYLPREDITLGEGHAHLYNADGEVADIDFANPDQVELRVQEESELEAKRWGSGVCIEMHLPVSLKFGENYYVQMDQTCFYGANGAVPNYGLESNDQWKPTLTGDFGIGGLYYAVTPEPEESEEAEEAEEAEAEATAEPEEEVPAEITMKPGIGDTIHFDLVLGGDAKTAVVFSENDSVYFEELEFTESTTVTGTITKDNLDWGVVFLDENDETVLDANGNAVVIKPAWAAETTETAETAEATEVTEVTETAEATEATETTEAAETEEIEG